MWNKREKKVLRIIPRFLTSATKMENAAGADVRGEISSVLDRLSLRCLLDTSIAPRILLAFLPVGQFATYFVPIAMATQPQAVTTQQCFASCSGHTSHTKVCLVPTQNISVHKFQRRVVLGSSDWILTFSPDSLLFATLISPGLYSLVR